MSSEWKGTLKWSAGIATNFSAKEASGLTTAALGIADLIR